MQDFEIYKNDFYREIISDLNLDSLNQELEFGSSNHVKEVINAKIAEVAKDKFDNLSLAEKQQLASNINKQYMQNLDNIMISSHYDGTNMYILTYAEKLLCTYIKEHSYENLIKNSTNQEKTKKQGFFSKLFHKNKNEKNNQQDFEL
jgi:MFS superfamily sulfate permease-like transporter